MKCLVGFIALLFCLPANAQTSLPASAPTTQPETTAAPLDTTATQPLLASNLAPPSESVSAPLLESAQEFSLSTIKTNLTPPFLLSLGATAGGYLLFDLVTGYRINHGATELGQVFAFNIPMDLALVGMFVGPSMGYLYTDQKRRALFHSVLRVSGALVVSRLMGVCLGRDCSFSEEGALEVVGALGGALWLGFSVYDLADLYGTPKGKQKKASVFVPPFIALGVNP